MIESRWSSLPSPLWALAHGDRQFERRAAPADLRGECAADLIRAECGLHGVGIRDWRAAERDENIADQDARLLRRAAALGRDDDQPVSLVVLSAVLSVSGSRTGCKPTPR